MEKLRKSDLLEQVCSFGDKLLKQLFNTTRAELKKELFYRRQLEEMLVLLEEKAGVSGQSFDPHGSAVQAGR